MVPPRTPSAAIPLKVKLSLPLSNSKPDTFDPPSVSYFGHNHPNVPAVSKAKTSPSIKCLIVLLHG